jgi:hypothetical protein
VVTVQQAIRRRRDWIRRNPEDAAMYIRLTARDKARVDNLFETGRGREVKATVHRLDSERKAKRSIVGRRSKALANIRGKLGDRPAFNDTRVAERVDTMTSAQLSIAAQAEVDDLIYLAKLQADRNPFWYK